MISGDAPLGTDDALLRSSTRLASVDGSFKQDDDDPLDAATAAATAAHIASVLKRGESAEERASRQKARRLKKPPGMRRSRGINDKMKAELFEAFQMMDVDSSGSIDVEELLHAMGLIGLKSKKSELLELINTVDVNRSGTMEFGEFLELMAMHLLTSEARLQTVRPLFPPSAHLRLYAGDLGVAWGRLSCPAPHEEGGAVWAAPSALGGSPHLDGADGAPTVCAPGPKSRARRPKSSRCRWPSGAPSPSTRFRSSRARTTCTRWSTTSYARTPRRGRSRRHHRRRRRPRSAVVVGPRCGSLPRRRQARRPR